MREAQDETNNILDDRHEIFNLYVSQCANCVHFKNGYICPAFPNGIPENLLEGTQQHNSLIKGQTGDYVFIDKRKTIVS